MKVLPQRFAKYGLEINAEKTKLVDFRRPRWGYDPKKHGPKPDTFSFLGFTHYWGKTWKGGHTIKRKTEGEADVSHAFAGSGSGAGTTGIVRWRSSTRRCARSCVVTTSITACAVTADAWNGYLIG